jgi:hypothetical protein
LLSTHSGFIFPPKYLLCNSRRSVLFSACHSLLAFNAIYQSIVANPANAEFKFTAETMEKFLSEILPDDYPENIALIRT